MNRHADLVNFAGASSLDDVVERISNGITARRPISFESFMRGAVVLCGSNQDIQRVFDACAGFSQLAADEGSETLALGYRRIEQWAKACLAQDRSVPGGLPPASFDVLLGTELEVVVPPGFLYGGRQDPDSAALAELRRRAEEDPQVSFLAFRSSGLAVLPLPLLHIEPQRGASLNLARFIEFGYAPVGTVERVIIPCESVDQISAVLRVAAGIDPSPIDLLLASPDLESAILERARDGGSDQYAASLLDAIRRRAVFCPEVASKVTLFRLCLALARSIPSAAAEAVNVGVQVGASLQEGDAALQLGAITEMTQALNGGSAIRQLPELLRRGCRVPVEPEEGQGTGKIGFSLERALFVFSLGVMNEAEDLQWLFQAVNVLRKSGQTIKCGLAKAVGLAMVTTVEHSAQRKRHPQEVGVLSTQLFVFNRELRGVLDEEVARSQRATAAAGLVAPDLRTALKTGERFRYLS